MHFEFVNAITGKVRRDAELDEVRLAFLGVWRNQFGPPENDEQIRQANEWAELQVRTVRTASPDLCNVNPITQVRYAETPEAIV